MQFRDCGSTFGYAHIRMCVSVYPQVTVLIPGSIVVAPNSLPLATRVPAFCDGIQHVILERTKTRALSRQFGGPVLSVMTRLPSSRSEACPLLRLPSLMSFK